MARGKDFRKTGENIDDFYKKKNFKPENHDGKDLERDIHESDAEGAVHFRNRKLVVQPRAINT